MSTRPAEGSPEEIYWLRGYEAARNEMLAENAKLRAVVEAARAWAEVSGTYDIEENWSLLTALENALADLDYTEAPRCKHAIHGEDCRECYP